MGYSVQPIIFTVITCYFFTLLGSLGLSKITNRKMNKKSGYVCPLALDLSFAGL